MVTAQKPDTDFALALAMIQVIEEEVIDDLFKPLSVKELKRNPSGMWIKGCKYPDDIIYKKCGQKPRCIAACMAQARRFGQVEELG
ncbi:MAG: hypothetical protein WA133_00020 [Syntrophales bacterium]